MSLLAFIVVTALWGFVVGGLARLALPGPDPMPWYATIGLGLGGSLVGGILARVLLGTYGGFVFAFFGAVLLLYLYRRFVQGRGLSGPAQRSRPRF
jgi:uncharacterized membrane protein YeaQ/YmgE (transglycosylase-associated protein family)